MRNQFDGMRFNLGAFLGAFDKSLELDYIAPNLIEKFIFEDGSWLDFTEITERVLKNAKTDSSDIIYGFIDKDTLDGGKGDDVLIGREGPDTYIFGRGYGADVINDADFSVKLFGAPPDTLQFIDGLRWSDFDYIRSGDSDDLKLQVKNTSDSVELLNQDAAVLLLGKPDAIERLVFGDGTVWTQPKLFQHFVDIAATSGDDTIFGFSGGEILDGKTGNDLLQGGGGSDTYFVRRGDGSDIVLDAGGGSDRLIFEGIGSLEVDILRTSVDLIFRIRDTGQTITLKNQYIRDGAQQFAIELLEFSDRTVSFTDLNPEDVDIVGTAQSEVLTGSQFRETLDGRAGDDTLAGGSDGDTYLFDAGYGNDTIIDVQERASWMGRQGREVETDDRIVFGPGLSAETALWARVGDDLVISFSDRPDSLTIRNQFRKVTEGVEWFEFGDQTLHISDVEENYVQIAGGNRGDNLITGFIDQENVLDGRQGDDTLMGGNQSDLYAFGIGYGFDEIHEKADAAGVKDRVVFGEGVTAESLILRRDGNDLLIDLGNGTDVLRIHGGLSTTSIEEFAFSTDGSVLTIAEIRARMLIGTEGHDRLQGFDVSADVIDGGAGSDEMIGGAGNDTYVFGHGDGQDSVIDSSGTDRILFRKGVTAEQVSFETDGTNLVIRLSPGGDSLVILGGAARGGTFQIESFEFDDAVLRGDGSVSVPATVLSLTDVRTWIFDRTTNSGQDKIDATLLDAESIVSAGRGFDSVILGANTEYVFSKGDGFDKLWIGQQTIGMGEIRFADYSSAEATVRLAGIGSDDLIISFPATGEGVQLAGVMGSSARFPSITFADGIAWTRAALLQAAVDGQASASDDMILGHSVGATITGGAGDDDLYGGAGADRYVFTRGDGRDVITDAGGTDVLELRGYQSSDILASRIDATRQELVLSFKDSNDEIILRSTSNTTFAGVETIRFSDGTTQSVTALLAQTAVVATDLSDVLTGGAGADTLEGRRGDDSLFGQSGNDTYVYTRGDGYDVIADSAGANRIVLRGYMPQEVRVLRVDSSDQLILRMIDGGEILTANSSAIASITFDGGTAWSSAQIADLALRHAETTQADMQIGTDAAETFYGNTGNDTIIGGFGNDTYVIGLNQGDDRIIESWGTDRIKFGPGITLADIRAATTNLDGDRRTDLTIGFANGTGTVTLEDFGNPEGYAGNAQLVETFEFADGTVMSRAAFLAATYFKGTVGNESIVGTDDNDTFSGSAGNDTLFGGDGSDVYLIGLNQGDDRIVGSELSDSIKFGAGIALADLRAAATNLDGDEYEDLTIGFVNGSGTVTIEDMFSKSYEYYWWNSDPRPALFWSVEFDDGMVISVSDFLDALYFAGTDGNDRIIGTDAAETLSGGIGNDTLIGGSGNDTYVVALDQGDDRIDEYGGTDQIKFGAGIALADIRMAGTNIDGDQILDLTIGFANGSGTLTIERAYDAENPQFNYRNVETVEFNDGTVLSWADFLAATYFDGTTGNDRIIGTDGNDTIGGDAGNDTLIGGPGDDTYVFAFGQGDDRIQDPSDPMSEYFGGTNTLVFADGVSLADLRGYRTDFDQDGSIDLTITSSANSGSLTIEDIDSWPSAIETVRFADGTEMLFTDLQATIDQSQPRYSSTLSFGGAPGVEVPSLTLTGAFTIESWVYFYEDQDVDDTNVPDVDQNDVLVSAVPGTAQNLNFGSGRFQLFSDEAGSAGQRIVSNTVSEANGWAHYAITRDESGILRVYVNGVLDATAPVPFADSFTIGMIGADGGMTGNLELDDLRIWSVVRSEAELQTGMSVPIEVTTPGLERAYSFDELDYVEPAEVDQPWQVGLKDDTGNSATSWYNEGSGPYSGSRELPPDDLPAGLPTAVSELSVPDFLLPTGLSQQSTEIELPHYLSEASPVDLFGAGTPVQGSATSDAISGTADDETIVGGAGNDILLGAGGNDSYVYARGDGRDIILDSSGTSDRLVLTGISAAAVTLQRGYANDLEVIIAPSSPNAADGGRILLRDALAGGSAGVDSIIFDDGTIWARDTFGTLVGQAAVTAGDDRIIGTAAADTLSGGAGDDLLSGGAGDDLYQFTRGDGSDIISETAGNDTLQISGYTAAQVEFSRRGAGGVDLTIRFAGTDDEIVILNGLAGTSASEIEQIAFADDGSSVSLANIRAELLLSDATNGNDLIAGTVGADTMTGGKGDDILSGGQGADRYIYKSGDGDDRIADFGTSGIDRVVLDILPTEIVYALRLGPDSADLVLRLPGTRDRIIIQNALSSGSEGVEEIEFSDGTVWTRTEMRAAALRFVQTAGDDNVQGFQGSDSISGGKGDDALIGEGGSDTYTIRRGDGDDRIREAISATDVDRVVFENYVSTEVSVERLYKGSDTIVFRFLSSGDTLTVEGALASDGRGIEEYVFSDGVIWHPEDVSNRLDNIAPIAVGDGYYTVIGERALTISAASLLRNDYDPDGHALHIVGVDGGDHGYAEINEQGQIVFTAAAGFSGATSFTYTISDGHNGFATGTVDLRVRPEAEAHDDTGFTIAEDQTLTIRAAHLLSNDADGDRMIIGSVKNAVNGIASIASNGDIVFEPVANFVGTASFTYVANTPEGGVAEATVTIVVTPVNDAPVAVNDSGFRTLENAAFDIAVTELLGNDFDIDLNAVAIVSVASSPDLAVTLLPTGDIHVVPRTTFFGTATFSYTISDGQGGTGTAQASVYVEPVDFAPVAGNDSFVTVEDMPQLWETALFLANDSDADGDALTITGLSHAVGGKVTLFQNGVLFVPDANFAGLAGFRYTVEDGQGGSATGFVTVGVTPVNDNPSAENDHWNDSSLAWLKGQEDHAITIRIADLMGNDSDVEGSQLTIGDISNAVHGTITLPGDGTIVFTPNQDYWGEAEFYYLVTDADGAVDQAKVTLWFENVDDAPPVANKDVFQVFEDVPTDIRIADILANDTDIDLDRIQFVAFGGTQGGQNGSLVRKDADTLTFMPALNSTFTASFWYTITDGIFAPTEGVIEVRIVPVNDEPIAGDDNDHSMVAGVPYVLRIADLMANDNDVEGTELTFAGVHALSQGSYEVFNNEFIVVYQAPGTSGQVTLDYLVSDGELTDSGRVRIDVSSDAYDRTITGTAIRDLLVGTALGETINGLAGDDVMRAEAGDDLVFGGDGADEIFGGAGYDTVDYSASDAGLRASLSTGIGQGGHAQGDQLVGIEALIGSAFADTLDGNSGDNLIAGGAGNDSLGGAAGLDTLHGEAGDDRIGGGAGADWIDGGLGSDTADYSASTEAVQISLAAGAASGGDAQGDSLVSIENLVGSDLADLLEGDLAANRLSGGRGEDTLVGGAGNDTLSGGRGADALTGGDGIDTADYSGSQAGVLVNMIDTQASGGDAQGDTFNSIEIVAGSFHNDTLIGDGADNTLRGGLGADVIDGGAGFDTADYSTAVEAIVLDLSGQTAGAGEAAGDVLLNIERVVGSFLNDTITGGTSDDSFEGGRGDDRLAGGEGSDTYYFGFDRGADSILEGDSAGMDRIVVDAAVRHKDVSLVREGDDLFIELENLGGFLTDSIRITNHFAGSTSGIEEIRFADGSSWSRSEILDLVRVGRFNAANDIYRFGVEDEPAVIDPIMLLANDATEGVDQLELISVQGIGGATASIGADGKIHFQGALNQNGDAFFDYTVRDSFGRESTARVQTH